MYNMENRSILQGSDLTERRSRRRLSSILKAPRSPLRDLGIGNELHQESTIDKRQKSSRRVSFAETIRVFTPESESAGVGDAELGGVGTDNSIRNENETTDGKCPITGMDRLLHGPLQAPAHQAELNYLNCNKDQTIFFSSDNDMDMTASNTVAIDGLIEEKPKKIDTSLFLASLKAPSNDESRNFDFKFSTASQKIQDLQPSTSSSSQAKIKFGDFLASLGNENTTLSNIGSDKENIFPFVSKGDIFSTKTTRPFFDTCENTGNITRVFRDQEDGLDLTKCHTTNITSFCPADNHQLTDVSLGNPMTSYFSTRNKKDFSVLEEAIVKRPKCFSTDQTVLCEDDMDMTFSHTTRIHGNLKEIAPTDKTKACVTNNNEKTIIFTNENEMELTQNNSVFFNSISIKGRQPMQRNSNAIGVAQATVYPEEDMDMTRSHSVAIDGPAICEVFGKNVTGDTVQSGLCLPAQMASSNSKSFENDRRGLTVPELDLKPLKSFINIAQHKPVLYNTSSEPEYRNAIFKNSCSTSTVNAPVFSTEKTILFECERDDMEMTRSHTIAIDSNAPIAPSNACILNPVLNDKISPFICLRLSPQKKTVLLKPEDDMDLTQSHTVHIEQKPLRNLSNSTQNPIRSATDKTKRFQENMEMTVVKQGLQLRSALEETDNKTVVFTCEQQDMDFTQSHTIAIDGNTLCKNLQLETFSFGNKELHIGSKIDGKKAAVQASMADKMTTLSNLKTGFPGICGNPAGVSCRKSGGQVYKSLQENTVVFPSDQDDMELTKSHTVAIDSKMLSESTHVLKSILKDKKSNSHFRLSAMHNKTLLFSSACDDMELTQSHTTSIDQNNLTNAKQKRISYAAGQAGHMLDDMEMTMVESDGLQRGPAMNESNNNKTVLTCDQQDMDITRSHTIAIDGDSLSLGFQSDTDLPIQKRAGFISDVSRCMSEKNMVLESKKDHQNVDKIDFVKEELLMPLSRPEIRLSGRCMNTTGLPLKKSTGQCQSTLEGSSVLSPCQDDMDMTLTNTVHIKSTLLPGESTTNKGITYGPCYDKTVVFEDDMEYTKSHTAIIDSIKQNEIQSQSVSGKCVTSEAENMNITKSNTVFIDNMAGEMSEDGRLQMYKNTFVKSFGPCDRIPDDFKMTTVSTKSLITDKAKVVTMPVLSKDKTFISLDEEFMDLTKSNTIAIENKIFNQVGKLQATNLSKLHENILSGDKVQHNANLADSKETDMDITKSNTVFIDHKPAGKIAPHCMIDSRDILSSQKLTGLHVRAKPVEGQIELKNLSDDVLTDDAQMCENYCLLPEASKMKLLRLSCHKNPVMTENHTSDIGNHLPFKPVELDLSMPNVSPDNTKMKAVSSHQTSCALDDETEHQLCNLKETNATIELAICNNHKRHSPAYSDQTISKQGEMEMTKYRRSAAIEGKLMEATSSKCLVDCDVPERKSTSLFSNDTSVKFTVNANVPLEAEVGKSGQGNVCRNEDSHQSRMEECVPPCEQETMKITKVEVSTAKENCCNNSSASSTLQRLGKNIQLVKVADVSTILSGSSQKCDNNLQPSDKTKRKGSKHNELSISFSNKTVMFSEDLGDMEFTQINTKTVHGLSEPGIKTMPAAIEKTCLSEAEMDITKCNTVFIDQKFQEFKCATFSSEIERPSNSVCLSFINNDEETASRHKDANRIVDMALDDEYDIRNSNELTDDKALCVDTETIPLADHTSVNGASGAANLYISSEQGNYCVSQEQKSVAQYICNQQSEVCAVPKNPGAAQDYEVTKRRLSKRVSFCFPEKDGRVGKYVVDPNIEHTLENREKLFLNNQPDGIQCKSENAGEMSLQFDFTDKVLIGCSETDNSVSEKDVLSSSKYVSEEVANNAEQNVSQKEKSRRRSIADIQLKIRSLTVKSTNRLSNQTTPSSCRTDEFSTSSQTRNSTSGNCIPEQRSISAAQENKDKPQERDPGTARDFCLQNRLSVNVLQPKLPSKRHSNTCNLQESASISKPPTQTSRKSLNPPKPLADDGQCIDEERLPADLDDHDCNSLFKYEVPEGAWEELCEKEALHKNISDDSTETGNSHKRARETEDNTKFLREKRMRRNDAHNTQTTGGFKNPEECSRSDYSSHHTSKSMEQTYCSSSSQDSRGEGMSVELSSHQYSQMDSQLPWDNGCGQNLWQKFQDGTIAVKEFFMLLRIRILIQKPRYSELPVNRGNFEALSSTDLMLDLFIYQPKLQVYEEEYHMLYRTTEELKLYTDMQEKPLIEVSSLLWEAMRMCSENELMCFGTTLKNLKSVYSKKSKILAHKAKVSIYSKLLHKAQVQVLEVQTRINEADKLLEEIDDCISCLQIETGKLEADYKDNWANIADGKEMQCVLENLRSQEQTGIRERSHLEERKEKVLTRLGCLQEEARGLENSLQESCFAEWDMVEWTDTKATFVFLYDSLELTILFGDEIDGEKLNSSLCKRISKVILMYRLNEEIAPPSSLLVCKLISQFIKKKGCLHETYKLQTDIPQLLCDVSLVVSRCKILGEEIEYLMKWGAKYNIVKIQVCNNEVNILFSSSATLKKFELSLQISEMYPTVPLTFTLENRIGNTEAALPGKSYIETNVTFPPSAP